MSILSSIGSGVSSLASFTSGALKKVFPAVKTVAKVGCVVAAAVILAQHGQQVKQDQSVAQIGQGPSSQMVLHNPHAAAMAQAVPAFTGMGLFQGAAEDQTALVETDGAGFLNEENHLEWEDAFHRGGTGYIDGIRPSAMRKSFMWGIDAWNRGFIALKLKCTRILDGGVKVVSEGATAIFQRYTGERTIVKGSHFMPAGCPDLGPLDPQNRGDFRGSLHSLLRGEEVPVTTGFHDETSYTLELADDTTQTGAQRQIGQ